MSAQALADSIPDKDVAQVIDILTKRLPKPEVLALPLMGLQHTNKQYWNYPQLQIDFELANPGVTVTREAIQATFRKKKVTVTKIRAASVQSDPLRLLTKAAMDDVFKKFQGRFIYTDKPARHLAFHLFLKTVEHEEEGEMTTLHQPKKHLQYLIGNDAAHFNLTEINTNGLPEIDIPIAPSLTPEQKSTLLSGLSKRHLNPDNNNYVHELIQLEFYVQYGVYYKPKFTELQPKELIGI